MSEQTRNALQEAIDAHVANEYGDFSMSKDWVLSAHVIGLEDVSDETGRLAIFKGAQTSVFTATGILVVANETYRNDHHEEGYEDE